MFAKMKQSDYLYEKRDLFLEMKDIALRQKDMVTEERIDRFLELSRQREGLQRKISAGETRAKGLIHRSPDAPGDGRARSIADDVTRIIQSIQDIDRQIESFVSENRDRLLNEIRGLRKGQKALKGYGGRTKKNPRFIDTKG